MGAVSHVQTRMRVVALANEGCSDTAIAAKLGITRYSVIAFLDEAKMLKRRIVVRKAGSPDRPKAERKVRALPRGIEIPAWVIKANLSQDFSDAARERGEHAAAAHCRALLRDMRAA